MSKLTGTVEKVFEHRKGKNKDSGKRWSVQRFILETEDDKVTCEAWGQRDLEDLQGEEVSVTGKMTKETFEGKTYDRFKLDAPPKVGGGGGRSEDDEPPRKRDDDDDDPPARDSWRVHLMKSANLLVKCHAAAIYIGLQEGEDARTLFIEMKRYIKDMPATRMDNKVADPEPERDLVKRYIKDPEPEPERDLPMPPHKPTPDDYGPGPEEDEDIPF